MRNFSAIVALGVLGLLASAAVQADQFGPLPQPLTRFSMDLGLTGGGDSLAVVSFNDGSSKNLYAGDSGYIDAGVMQNFGDPRWSLKGTLGYAYTGIGAHNASIGFSRLPLEIIGLYNLGNNHFGLGLRYDINPHLDLAGFEPNENFDNALGWVAVYRWWMFGLRFANITYRSPQGDVNGNNWGLFFNFTF